MATIASPPRMTGNAEVDQASIVAYLGELFRAFVVDGLVAGDAPTVDVEDLPDPSSTSLATAQQTANDAYIAAVGAQETADTANANALRLVEFGEVTISEASTTAVFTFANAFDDTNYVVLATPQTFTGMPNVDAFVKETETRAVDSVTIGINTAPGAAASVTFNILILKST